jgi:hypothetical protein
MSQSKTVKQNLLEETEELMLQVQTSEWSDLEGPRNGSRTACEPRQIYNSCTCRIVEKLCAHPYWGKKLISKLTPQFLTT